MKKTLTIIICVILIACMLCSCTEKQTLTTEDGISFSYEKMSVMDSFETITPETQSNQILCVTISVPFNTDIDAVKDAFFGENPSTVTDGTNTYACKAVAYGNGSDSIVFNALYEIPSGMVDTQFTVNGSFGSFSGTAK